MKLASWVSGSRTASFAVASAFAASALCGCGDSGDGSADKGSGANVVLRDENNYLSTSALDIPVVETAVSDIDVCWSDLDSDLQCHDVAPEADVDTVALLRFLNLTEEQVEGRLASGQLASSEVDRYVDYKTDHQSTCTKLSAMSFFGTPVDVGEEYFESEDHRYMLLFNKGTTPGVGARTMTFVKPTATSTNTRVEAPSGCGLLDFSADLSSLTPVSIPASGPWVVDWRNVERDSQGNPIAYEMIDGALIGFYEGKTVADVEAEIFDIELIATALWELRLTGGRSADLANAQKRGSGEPFAGFDTGQSGTWLLGLMCSACQNPAPLILTVLSPE